jgi:hypothetical protein
METKQFNRKGILIAHDLEKATLTFAFAGLTPNKMGTYYLIHQSELEEFRNDVEELITYADMLCNVIEDIEKRPNSPILSDEEIEELRNMWNIKIKNHKQC